MDAWVIRRAFVSPQVGVVTQKYRNMKRHFFPHGDVARQQYPAIAARYGKTASVFPGAIHLADAVAWLNG
ncbi:hypothetical protein [Thiobacillus sp.]|uniref:hypothetical protein n=1 Tax=Thiobacillus sp. TaxID=924 RepID=UPI0025CDA826|nr:hypothetical protein [Thiobacillus sp.]